MRVALALAAVLTAAFTAVSSAAGQESARESAPGCCTVTIRVRVPEGTGMSTHFPLSEAVVAQSFPGLVTTPTPDATPYVIRDIEAGLRAPHGVRYRFDYGTLGLDSTYGPTHAAVRAWLLKQGLVEGRDFVVRRYEGATHSEASGRARLDDPLQFLYGSDRRP
jgi:hypothetical protein